MVCDQGKPSTTVTVNEQDHVTERLRIDHGVQQHVLVPQADALDYAYFYAKALLISVEIYRDHVYVRDQLCNAQSKSFEQGL